MRKKEELGRTDTCMAHAHPQEMVFVLLSRDIAAPAAIRAWVNERVRIGKNTFNDPQIIEALACADTMVDEGRRWVGAKPRASTSCPAVRACRDDRRTRVRAIVQESKEK